MGFFAAFQRLDPGFPPSAPKGRKAPGDRCPARPGNTLGNCLPARLPLSLGAWDGSGRPERGMRRAMAQRDFPGRAADA
jgi:hypothetical protein